MFIVVCGISGVGKSTLLRNLKHPKLVLPRSVTTREKRISDPETEYLFVTSIQFEEAKSVHKFLIHQTYHQEQYGILNSDYKKIISEGKVAIKDIGYEGILQLKQKIDQVPCIWITAPIDQLVVRMKQRGDKKDQIEERLSKLKKELLEYERVADYLISNNQDFLSCEKSFQKVLTSILRK